MDIKKRVPILFKENVQVAIFFGLLAVLFFYSTANSNPSQTNNSEKLSKPAYKSLPSPSVLPKAELTNCTFPVQCENKTLQITKSACDSALCCQFRKNQWKITESKRECDEISPGEVSSEALSTAMKMYNYLNLQDDPEYKNIERINVVIKLATYLTWDPEELETAKKTIKSYETKTNVILPSNTSGTSSTKTYEDFGWYMNNGQSMQYVYGQWYTTPQQGIIDSLSINTQSYKNSTGTTKVYGPDGYAGTMYTDTLGSHYTDSTGYSSNTYYDTLGSHTYDNSNNTINGYKDTLGTHFYGSNGSSINVYKDTLGTHYYGSNGKTMNCYTNTLGTTCY